MLQAVDSVVSLQPAQAAPNNNTMMPAPPARGGSNSSDAVNNNQHTTLLATTAAVLPPRDPTSTTHYAPPTTSVAPQPAAAAAVPPETPSPAAGVQGGSSTQQAAQQQQQQDGSVSAAMTLQETWEALCRKHAPAQEATTASNVPRLGECSNTAAVLQVPAAAHIGIAAAAAIADRSVSTAGDVAAGMTARQLTPHTPNLAPQPPAVQQQQQPLLQGHAAPARAQGRRRRPLLQGLQGCWRRRRRRWARRRCCIARARSRAAAMRWCSAPGCMTGGR